MPKASIIIRTFNEEKHLGSLLKAIAEQEYRDYEIILVDSGSTDRTIEIAKQQCNEIVQIASHDFTFGYSLNAGAQRSQGDYFVIVSAHAIPTNPYWLQLLLRPFVDARVAMTYGRHIGTATTKFSEKRDFNKYFSASPHQKHPLSYFTNNANSAIRASVWRTRQFDEYLAGLEDIAWAKYAIENGSQVVYEPKAAVYHIHEETWPRVYHRYRREAIAARRIHIPTPPLASPHFRSFFRNIVGDIFAIGKEFSYVRLKEIFLFRYHQWRGAYHGWYRDAAIDMDKEHTTFYYGNSNVSVVITEKQKAQLQETPTPEVKPGDVLIRVAYTGICATDLEVYEGTLGYYKKGMAQYPIIPGHEFSGVVSRVGANVTNCKPGDHVVGECILSCRTCTHCLAGAHTACPTRREVGVMNAGGAYTRFLSLPAMYVHKIPPHLDLQRACLAEPLAVVLRGIRRLGDRLKKSSRCAVIGAGPIGNLCAQALTVEGHHVTVFNRSEGRLHYIKHLVETRQILQALHAFDVIVEATGSVEALEIALRESRTDATHLLLGFPYGAMTYNFEDTVGQEKVIVGSVGGSAEDFTHALQLLPKLDTTHFTQCIFPFKDFTKAWDAHREGKQLKVILKIAEDI